MKQRKVIAKENIDDVWTEIQHDFSQEGNHDYHVSIHNNDTVIDVDIISSPGGGGEGGYGSTKITAALPAHSTFQFSITPRDIINSLGKLFGMQDIKVGYPEFDSSVIIKSNDVPKVKEVFSNHYVREVFRQLSGFTFGIKKHPELEVDYLEFAMQRAVINLDELDTIYTAIAEVLTSLNAAKVDVV